MDTGGRLLVLGRDCLQTVDWKPPVRSKTIPGLRGQHPLPHGLGLQQVQRGLPAQVESLETCAYSMVMVYLAQQCSKETIDMEREGGKRLSRVPGAR